MPNFCPNCGAQIKFFRCWSLSLLRCQDKTSRHCGGLYRNKLSGLLSWHPCFFGIVIFFSRSTSGPSRTVYQPRIRYRKPVRVDHGKHNYFIRGDLSHSGTNSCHLDMTGTHATDFVSQSVDLTNAPKITFWGIGENNSWPFSVSSIEYWSRHSMRIHTPGSSTQHPHQGTRGFTR